MNRYVYSKDGINADATVFYSLPTPYDTWSKADRMSVGWYDAIIQAPEPVDGESYCLSGWTRIGDEFHATFTIIPKPIPTEEATRYSVRSIIRELKACGKYDAVRSLLETAKYDWEFVGSNYLVSDDADFQKMLTAVVE